MFHIAQKRCLVNFISLLFRIAAKGIVDKGNFLYKNITQDWQRHLDDVVDRIKNMNRVTHIEKLDFLRLKIYSMQFEEPLIGLGSFNNE